MGDKLALATLQKLASKIAKHYKPGALVNIVMDGDCFGDLFGISHSTIEAYQSELGKMTKGSSIRLVDPLNLSNKRDPNSFRRYLEEIGATEEEIRTRIVTDPGTLNLYVHLSRVIHEDLDRSLSSKVRSETSKQYAMLMMQRNDALRQIVLEEFSESVRLSVHRQPDIASRIGINLIPGQEGTPTHRVAVIRKDKTVSMMKRSDAEARNYELFYHNDRPYGFIER